MRIDALLEYFRTNPHYIDAVMDLGISDGALRKYIYRIEEEKKAIVLRSGTWKNWLVVPTDRPLAPQAIPAVFKHVAKHIYFQLGILVRKYKIRDGDPNVEEILKAIRVIEMLDKSVREYIHEIIELEGEFK